MGVAPERDLDGEIDVCWVETGTFQGVAWHVQRQEISKNQICVQGNWVWVPIKDVTFQIKTKEDLLYSLVRHVLVYHW